MKLTLTKGYQLTATRRRIISKMLTLPEIPLGQWCKAGRMIRYCIVARDDHSATIRMMNREQKNAWFPGTLIDHFDEVTVAF